LATQLALANSSVISVQNTVKDSHVGFCEVVLAPSGGGHIILGPSLGCKYVLILKVYPSRSPMQTLVAVLHSQEASVPSVH